MQGMEAESAPPPVPALSNPGDAYFFTQEANHCIVVGKCAATRSSAACPTPAIPPNPASSHSSILPAPKRSFLFRALKTMSVALTNCSTLRRILTSSSPTASTRRTSFIRRCVPSLPHDIQFHASRVDPKCRHLPSLIHYRLAPLCAALWTVSALSPTRRATRVRLLFLSFRRPVTHLHPFLRHNPPPPPSLASSQPSMLSL